MFTFFMNIQITTTATRVLKNAPKQGGESILPLRILKNGIF